MVLLCAFKERNYETEVYMYVTSPQLLSFFIKQLIRMKYMVFKKVCMSSFKYMYSPEVESIV
jgi:hypothetical protein